MMQLGGRTDRALIVRAYQRSERKEEMVNAIVRHAESETQEHTPDSIMAPVYRQMAELLPESEHDLIRELMQRADEASAEEARHSDRAAPDSTPVPTSTEPCPSPASPSDSNEDVLPADASVLNSHVRQGERRRTSRARRHEVYLGTEQPTPHEAALESAITKVRQLEVVGDSDLSD